MADQTQYARYVELRPPFVQNIDDAPSNLSANEYPLLEHVVDYKRQLWPIVEMLGTSIDGSATLVSAFTLPDATQQNVLWSSASKMYYANVALPSAVTLTEITCATSAITAASNANPVSMTIAATPSPATWPVTITGFTGNWAPCNGSFTATRTGATTFTIPVDSTTFGAVTGTPVVQIWPISADSAGSKPWAIAFVNGSLYFAHDGNGPLRVWAGGATYAFVAAPASGYHASVFIKPYYLTAQNNRLIILGDASSVGSLYDVIGSTTTNAADFVSFGSFYTQLLDTPDKITGGSILASKLIVYKKDSIVVGTLTGDATTPYSFERYQQSTSQSIGCLAPYSLVNDGGFRDVFVSRYGVVVFDGSGFKMIGAGQDAAIMAFMQLATGSGAITPAQATLGSIYTQGTAFPTATSTVGNATNNPARYYLILPQPGTGLTSTMFLLNMDTMAWSTLSATTYGVGAMYFANTDSVGSAAPGSQKYLVIGTTRLSLPTLAVSSVAMSSGQGTGPVIRIGGGSAVYGPESAGKVVTVQRVGLELMTGVAVNQTAVTFTPKVLIGGTNNSMTPSTTTGSAQTGYPAVNPTVNAPLWAWIDIGVANNGTCHAPIVEIDWPLDTTARFWPRISRIVIEYQLGDDT